jgi:hypothetical protein
VDLLAVQVQVDQEALLVILVVQVQLMKVILAETIFLLRLSIHQAAAVEQGQLELMAQAQTLVMVEQA